MFQRVKGMEDFYPEDKLLQNHVFSVLRKSAKNFGFYEVEAPVVESLKLLTAKSGEEVEQQIFVMKKKGDENKISNTSSKHLGGDEDLGLRFDITVPLTRMFVAKQKEMQKPIKWFSIDKAWRYESPQKGRQREFYQFSVELFGSEKHHADAELLNLLISSLNDLGLKKKDFMIKLNHRKLFEGLLLDIVSKGKIPAVAKIIDKIGKISEQEFHKELLKQGISNVQIEKIEHLFTFKGSPSEVLRKIQMHAEVNKTAQEGLDDLKRILEHVDEEYFVMDLSIMRGFDYYTGFVFECVDRAGKFRAIAGGGRYDSLVELFGGEPCSATGFGMGYSTLLLALEEAKALPKINREVDFYIAPVDETVEKQSAEIANILRKKYSVDVDLVGRKLSKQLEFANNLGAKKVVIVGQKDLSKGEITIRDLKSGKEGKEKLKNLEKL